MLLMWAHTAPGNRCPVCAYPTQCPERAGDQPEPSKEPSAKNKLESYKDSQRTSCSGGRGGTQHQRHDVVGQGRRRSPCCRTRGLSIPPRQAETQSLSSRADGIISMLEGFVLAPGMLLRSPSAKRPGALLRHPPAPPPASGRGVLASLAVGRAEPKASPPRPETSAHSITPSQLCQQQIYLGFFFFPLLERFRKKKITFQRHHLRSCSVPVKIKRVWVDF